ncbi:MAG: type ISP restriction/modification enzyme [Terriglobia bacterium]
MALRKQTPADQKIGATEPEDSSIPRYLRVPEDCRKDEKLAFLKDHPSVGAVVWQRLYPSETDGWVIIKKAWETDLFLPLGTKAAKAADSSSPQTVFKVFSGGVKTNRDEVTYDFAKDSLRDRVRRFIDDYNGEVDRYERSGNKQPVDEFVRYDKIKWSRDLKLDLQRGNYATFDEKKIRTALYRPFCRRWLFFDRILDEEVYVNPGIFPTPATEKENIIIWAKVGTDWPFFCLASRCLVDVLPQSGSQCFPFYTYDEGKTNHRENITDWVLEHFRNRCKDKKITKWDIFYYVYGVLHHPEYRSKYAEDLKRELPRLPPVDNFWGFSKAGKELAGLHIDYEKLEPWPLELIETTAVTPASRRQPDSRRDGGATASAAGTSPLQSASVAASLPRHGGVKPPLRQAERRAALQSADPSLRSGQALKVGATIPLSYRVEDKMRLAKDHRSLKVNDSLTLGGIPPETFEYRLGNRSALEWVIDQYQVTEDKHSGIRSDPNRPDDPEYIGASWARSFA